MADTIEKYSSAPVSLEVPYPSKVALPVHRPPIIRRQRLLDLVAQGLARRVTIISAPAGYGKTSLILDFARSCDLPVCWFSLDEREQDLGRFLRYLLASGQRQFPSFGGNLALALRQGEPISPEEAVDLLVTAVQAVGEPYVMILDDFHHLDGASPEEALEVGLQKIALGDIVPGQALVAYSEALTQDEALDEAGMRAAAVEAQEARWERSQSKTPFP